MNKIVVDKLKQTMIEVAWIQWRSLGSLIDTERSANSVVDPEALLLISLALRNDERRLWDILGSWAQNGSGLFSVQRVKNIREGFPDVTKDRLAEFAHMAKNEGKDHRWRNLAGSVPGPPARNQSLWKPYPSSWESSALLLRLRLGFGVGIVPDLLGFLLSLQGNWARARLIAKATGYSVYSIRRAADNLDAGDFLESTREKPVGYRVKPDAWRQLLSLDREVPYWRFWYQVYSFVAHVITLAEIEERDSVSPYLLSSRLRDLMEAHREAFILNQIEVPDPTSFLGEKYLAPFEDTISILTNWMVDVV